MSFRIGSDEAGTTSADPRSAIVADQPLSRDAGYTGGQLAAVGLIVASILLAAIALALAVGSLRPQSNGDDAVISITTGHRQ